MRFACHWVVHLFLSCSSIVYFQMNCMNLIPSCAFIISIFLLFVFFSLSLHNKVSWEAAAFWFYTMYRVNIYKKETHNVLFYHFFYAVHIFCSFGISSNDGRKFKAHSRVNAKKCRTTAINNPSYSQFNMQKNRRTILMI